MVKETRLHLRLTEEEKTLWQKAAEAEGAALSQYIRETVNAAAGEAPAAPSSPENMTVDELHGYLEGVIIRHFLRQYNWEEMQTLLDLLDRMDVRSIELCSGLHVPLDLLKLRWNESHPARPLR